MKATRRLFHFFPAMRLWMAISIIIGGLAALLFFLQAIFLSQILATFFLEARSLRQVWPSMQVFLMVLVLRACLTGGNVLVTRHLAEYIKQKTRTRLLAHLFALGPISLRGERSGELVNTIVEGTIALAPYVSQYLPQVFLALLVPILMVTVICCIDLPSGILLLILLPVLPFLMAITGMMAGAESRRHWHTLGLLSAHFLDTIQGLSTIKLCGQVQQAEEQIRQVSGQFRQTTMKTLRIAFFSSFLLEESATVSTAVIALELGLRLLLGAFPFQTALLLLFLTPEVFQPLRQLGTMYHAGLTGSVAFQRMVEILETPVQSQGTTKRLAGLAQESQQAEDVLVLEQVSYAYDALRPALHQVSFTITAGQKVALIGASGAGKSTLVHLLLRFIEPASGRMLLGGKSLDEMTLQEWRAQIAWVPQHPYLFQATIAENICLGNTQATREQILQAARLAQLDAWIRTLPQGYETMIGERGARLSGGEAQRISIARAFLKDAPFLVLDEATSYLDAEHETLVQDALNRLKQGRTVLMIAHRLSTIQDADQIIVLEKGEVMACGNHLELLHYPNLYRRMVETSQKRMDI